MILSFQDREAAKIWDGKLSRRLPPTIQQRILQWLRQLDAAADLEDLRIPPSNRLEGLKGDRNGQFSIRVNDQWRICFVWRDGNAWNVEVVDYHD